MEMDDKQVIFNVKKIRSQKGISQRKMAELLGIDPANYNRIENNLTSLKFETIIDIAKALEVDPFFLISDDEQIQQILPLLKKVSPEHKGLLMTFLSSLAEQKQITTQKT